MSLSSLNSIGQTVFKVRVRKQKCGQTDGWTDRRINTNFERNLAMMMIYVPVKFEFDWTNHFRIRVRKRKCGQTDKRTNKQTELHEYRKEPSYDGDLCPCQV